MPLLPDIETAFRRRARSLMTPLAIRFDAAEWQQAFSAIERPTPQDRQLLNAALWVGREAGALHAAQQNGFGPLKSADAVILGVASINHQFQVTNTNAAAERERAVRAGALGFDYLSNVPIDNDLGQRMSSGDFIEPAIDALESWLFDAMRLPVKENLGQCSEDRRAIAERLIVFYSLRRALKGVFDKALHLGHHLSGIPRIQWHPLDKNFAELAQAWQARSEANFASGPMHLSAAWTRMSPAQRRTKGLRRSVVSARHREGDVELIVGELPYLSRRPTLRAMDRLALEESYLNIFLERSMPLRPALTIGLLVDAWWVIADAARALWAIAHPSATLSVEEARGMACAVPKASLKAALVDALFIEPDQAVEIIDFLTFAEKQKVIGGKRARRENAGSEQGHRGLWSAPLVHVPGENAILLPRPVFEIGSSLFRVEAWLEKGGIDDTEFEHRGELFEKSYRGRIVRAVGSNASLPKAIVVSGGIDACNDFPEQIDLVIRLGSKLLVGEVKFLLTPADPHQWQRHFLKLADAAEQANRKARLLASRPDVIACKVGIPEAEARDLVTTPLVVLNHGAGFSLEIEGCRVVDAEFLWTYLNAPQMTIAGVRKGKGRIVEQLVRLYTDEEDAAGKFDLIMAKPFPLKKFVDRIEWRMVPYPRPSGGDFYIASPFRGDLTMTERIKGAELLNIPI